MDICIFMIGLIIGIFGIIFWILLFKHAVGISTSSQRKIFKKIALKTNGKVDGTFKPKLSFTHKGCIIEVTGNPEHEGHGGNRDRYIPPRTEVLVYLRKNVAYKMIIKNNLFRHKITSKLGVKYIKTGYDRFDRQCVVKGDKEFALRMLNYKIMDKLSSSINNIESFYIELKGERLLMRKRAYSENEFFLNFQIDKATSIIDRLDELDYI